MVAILSITVLALLAAVVAQPWQSGPTTGAASPSAATTASPHPTATTPGTSAAPTAGPTTSPDWADLQLDALVRVASITADQTSTGGLPAAATFTLASLSGEPATELARRLEVSPSVELAVAQVGDSAHARLTPRSQLQPGVAYRFLLKGPDDSLQGSWAFQVRGPVHVLSTLPGDHSTATPPTTGIEVTFDQDGVADMSDHFAIAPAVTGRFERHGRTQVFVPTSALKPATVYTVTIRKGLPRTGTDLTLESDVTFAFETESSEQTADRTIRIVPERAINQSAPKGAPVLAVWVFDPESDDAIQPPDQVKVRVYRLPSLDAAAKVVTDYLAAPTWADYSDPVMPTTGLPAVATFTAKLEAQLPDSADRVIRFPEPLAAGSYIIELQLERPSYAYLQVTPVSAWTSVLTDRTVVWVNDVATGKPIPGATVARYGGRSFGSADASGLIDAPTPGALIPATDGAGDTTSPATPLLAISAPGGDTLLLPFGVETIGDAYRGEWSGKEEPGPDSTYWSIALTDRDTYRATDRIDTWGYLRGRDDGSVPRAVEVRLVNAIASDSPPVASATIQPDRSGAWVASLAYDHLPYGGYEIQVRVGGRVVAAQRVEVAVIRKPAYALDAVTDHEAVVAGTKVTWTATATFFEGTPAPAVKLAYDADGTTRTITTDASGRAKLVVKTAAGDGEDPDDQYRMFRPVGEEYGEIEVASEVLVFPSAVDLQGSAILRDRALDIEATLSKVDLAAVERAIRSGTDWSAVAPGAPVSGTRVKAIVTELIPVRTQVGTTYDFIEKIARPVYEYSTQRKAVRTLTLTSGTRGRITTSVAVPNADHTYEVVLTAKDAAGRTERKTLFSGEQLSDWWYTNGVSFATADGAPLEDTSYAIGERIAWQMVDDGTALPGGGQDRYLYLVAQRGLRSASVTDQPTFTRRFQATDAPGVFVVGVRFTGSTYAPKAAQWADFDASSRKLTVTVTADKARYRPGQTATVGVRVADAAGKPVRAAVAVQAVDEKLYAIGAASIFDPLDALYTRVDSGIVRLAASHQVPGWSGREGEGGDTSTGGGYEPGARTDFRDRILFEQVTTGGDGRASIRMKLSDDLTSWHIYAGATTPGLEAGYGELQVPVGLPFFVEPVVADGYLTADRPSISLRAFGDALRAGDAIEFTVASASLGMAPTKATAKAFATTRVALAKLSPGRHTLTISARTTTRKDANGKPYRDAMEVPVLVVDTRLSVAETSYLTVGDPLPTIRTDGLVTYTFADAGRGRYLGPLLELVEPGSARLDRSLADEIAHDVLVDDFGRDPATLPAISFDPNAYPVAWGDGGSTSPNGVGLLPYSGADPWLAAQVAVLAPGRFRPDELRSVLDSILRASTTKRDLGIAALAGTAAMGGSVHDDLDTVARIGDLSVTERLYLALGYEAIGDDEAAIAIERDLLERYGERLGGWVRLHVGETAAGDFDATALAAVVAAGVGDPLAADLGDYVAANPSGEAPGDLELAATAERAIARTPATAASFAYSVAGKRTVVKLGVGESLTIELTPKQRTGLSLEPLTGKVSAAVSWRRPSDPSSIKGSPYISLRRTLPANPIAPDHIVTVDLNASFQSGAPRSDCYEVVEQVPSGLAPLEGTTGVAAQSLSDISVVWPSSMSGQEVRFCVPNSPEVAQPVKMRYLARVVNQGTFTWESAVIQLPGAAELVALTPAAVRRIGTK